MVYFCQKQRPLVEAMIENMFSFLYLLCSARGREICVLKWGREICILKIQMGVMI